MLEIDIYHEIHTKGFLFGAANNARDTRISNCRQAVFWQSPSQFINNLGASGYAVFIAPIPLLINRFRSPNHRTSTFNNHCSLIVSDLSLFPPKGFFFLLEDMFLFELSFPFNMYHSGLLKCCFSAEAACKL